jgi:hypothetical protein
VLAAIVGGIALGFAASAVLMRKAAA